MSGGGIFDTRFFSTSWSQIHPPILPIFLFWELPNPFAPSLVWPPSLSWVIVVAFLSDGSPQSSLQKSSQPAFQNANLTMSPLFLLNPTPASPKTSILSQPQGAA